MIQEKKMTREKRMIGGEKHDFLKKECQRMVKKERFL